jgi:hypothetical protein
MTEAPAAGNGLVEAHGLWWPPNLGATPEEFLRQAEDVDEAVELCAQRRTAVQAGGHCGQWARRLRQLEFARVLTFEPDETNYWCLRRNGAVRYPVWSPGLLRHDYEWEGINAWPGLLGAQRGYATLSPTSKNSGAGWAAFDNRGPLTVYTVDQFAFVDLDLLCLDVEGAELLALMGAEDTIARCKPVILYEERQHGYRYGHTPEDIVEWLKGHGYRFARKVRKDRIFVHAG